MAALENKAKMIEKMSDIDGYKPLNPNDCLS